MKKARRTWAVGAALCFSFLSSCQKEKPAGNDAADGPGQASITKKALSFRAGGTGSGETLFVSRGPQETGIAPVVTPDPNHPFAYFYGSGMGAGGVAVGDFDNDGWPDLFLAGSPGGNRLYRQVSPLKFEDVTQACGLHRDTAWSRGASMVDVDNDGDLDIYVANYGQDNYLYINKGSMRKGGPIRFVEEAAQRGVNVIDACLVPSFCDYDQDGDLDFYLLTSEYIWPDPSQPPDPKQMIGERDGKPIINPPYDKFFKLTDYRRAPSGKGFDVKWDRTGRPDFLFRNDGRGSFEEVTLQAGMQHGDGRGLSATWWDYNDDGYPDLYLGNDWMDRDYLYHNNGDGTFRDATEDAVPHTPMFTMGADAGDLNNDGRIDLMTADMSGTTHYKRKISMGTMQADKLNFMASARPPQSMRNAVYLNTGTGRLLEAAYLLGVANSDWSWAVKINDFDNDGRNDVFVTNGMDQNIRELEGGPQNAGTDLRSENNLAFRNLGDLQFAEVGEEWGLAHFGFSLAAASCDFDRDGDLDLFVIQREGPPILHKNTSQAPSIVVKLQGQTSNQQGLGATIRITTPSGRQVRELRSARGYLSSDEPIAHFGLGVDSAVDRLEVEWPSGHRQSFDDLEAGFLYRITEPPGNPPARVRAPEAGALFAAHAGLSGVQHTERIFDDFAVQPLLPSKLSQLGPGVAVGDLDGDDDPDFVLGGAAGECTQILINKGGGKFGSSQRLAGTERFEDMGLLLFDVDGDHDRDLLVVSGGVESTGPDLQDRLYLNDGTGKFSPSPEGSLPRMEESGGPVAAADIDRDGDLDLFLGGRVVPGQYPIAPASRLLVNEGGSFRDATPTLAVGLGRTGLVTGAVFADLDGDGWQDLLLAREWDSIAYFHNNDGVFTEQSERANLAPLTGWWNGIAVGDLDQDGDLDFVATNTGYNTKYHASGAHPALLYYGSFGTGTMRLVEAEYEKGVLFPVRGKSCSTRAIPHLGNRFRSFHDFALAELNQIYTPAVMEDVIKFSATTLASGVFLNNGEGRFEFRELPRLAQVAPAFGVVVNDLDGDGKADLYLAQNFATPQPETGTMSGGMSLMLRGLGDGSFEPLWPRVSGLIVSEDATSAGIVDLNGDAWPDLLVGSNNGPVRSFLNRGAGNSSEGQMIRVSLRGRAGNLDAVGARVTVQLSDGSWRIGEVRAGDSYLSQSSSALFFGTGREKVNLLMVRWPDGSTSSHEIDHQQSLFTLSQPEAATAGAAPGASSARD